MRVVVVIGLGCLLAGCAAGLIRKDAAEKIQAGQYEAALKAYEDGLKRYPEEPVLRSGATTAKSEIATRLLTAAVAQRSAGNDKEAEALLRRLLKMDANNDRAKALLLDLERDRRQKADLERAGKLVAEKKYEAALSSVEAGLKDNPRNPELLALQRRLELEQRSAGAGAGAIRLADTRPITLEFRDANLKMLLEAISRSTGIDFILDKDIRPDLRTTIFLRGTRLEDALELITSSNQLSKKILDPRTVLIYPNTPEKLRDYQDLVIKAFHLANSEAKQTAALLRSVLKIKEPFVDEKLNMIVLREPPETIRLAERLVALHDVGEPEVMLEVEVLEVKTSRLLDLGIKFPDAFTLTALPATGADGLTLRSVGSLNRDRIGVSVPDITINLKRDVGDFNTLANPRIRVKNRDKAKILVGDKVPVITTTAGSQGFVGESVSYLDVGLKVEVEPQIGLDDEVAIKVNLEVSSLAREIRTSGGGLAYQIGTRSATTALRLRDGETQLLAGLISNEDRMNASRVPGLGDLPLLGRLFATQRDDSQRTEVVLSITPRVLKNIRRPDVNMTEFWSGSETAMRLRPLTLASAEPAKVSGAASTASGGAAPQPGPVQTAGGTAPVPVGSGAPASVSLSPGAGGPALAIGAPGASSPAEAAGPALAQLALQGPQNAANGATFEVALNINTTIPIRGLPLQLEFDRAKLELVESGEGEFFKQNGAAVSVSRNVDAAQGRASLGVIRNTADGASGAGTILKLKFKAKAAGDASIRIVSATPIVVDRAVTAQTGDALKVLIK